MGLRRASQTACVTLCEESASLPRGVFRGLEVPARAGALTVKSGESLANRHVDCHAAEEPTAEARLDGVGLVQCQPLLSVPGNNA